MEQVLKCIDKDMDGKVTSEDVMGVVYVPLFLQHDAPEQ